jgi:hypothetical protein
MRQLSALLAVAIMAVPPGADAQTRTAEDEFVCATIAPDAARAVGLRAAGNTQRQTMQILSDTVGARLSNRRNVPLDARQQLASLYMAGMARAVQQIYSIPLSDPMFQLDEQTVRILFYEGCMGR